MLHITGGTPTVRSGATRVRCRARTWHVVDERATPSGTCWRLVREGDTPRLIAAPPDDVAPVIETLRAGSRRAWVGRVRTLMAAAAPPWWPRHAHTLPLTMRPFQFVPAIAMLSGHHRRLLVADEIGAGKTIEAGVLLREVHVRDGDAATLVVTPASLVAQWRDELHRLSIDVRVLDAEAFRREAVAAAHVVDAARAGSCWLLSVDLLRQPDVTRLVGRTPWTLLVVDEAHQAAPGSARMAALSRLADVSARVLLLTGTPTAAGAGGAEALRGIGGRPGERPMAVLRRSADSSRRPLRRTVTLSVDLQPAHLALCARVDRFVARARRERGADGLLPALVLRRRAASCPDALRRSIARRLEVLGTASASAWAQPPLFDPVDVADAGDAEDALLHVAAWADGQEERRELQRLHDLAAGLPAAGRKGEAVARLVRRCREPVVVFTAYLDTLRALRPLLAGARVVVVHGQQPEALRRAAIEAFTQGGADVLLTTDACAEGLNLHARCRTVIHAEVPPSSRVFRQRTGRVDRHGQTRRVHTIVLSSATDEDARALARLRETDVVADAWIADASSAECRRTWLAVRVAGALATHCRPAMRNPRRHPVQALTETATQDRDGPIVVRLSPRRWRRLCLRLRREWPVHRLWFGRLRLSGGSGLTQVTLPLAIVTGDGAPPPTAWTAAQWQQHVPGAWRRAWRLARRLSRWDAEAHVRCVAHLRADLPEASLFDENAATRETPTGRVDVVLSASFEVDTVVERRR